MKNKCIIIPAYNEEENIFAVISSVKFHSDAEIIVIDDASKDLTAENAKKAGAIIVKHIFNMGYGVALQTGYKYAVKNNYDLLIQMDGDGQHDSKYISELFNHVESGKCDIVIGSRFLGKGSYKTDFLKTIGIRLFSFIIQVTCGKRITDPTSGYQCLNRKVFTFFTHDSFPCDYPDANIIIMLQRMAFTVKEIPVTMHPNPEGRTMHKGIFTISYYLFKMFLSIFITLIREKSYYN
jgi:glycosyltransferase involved in cell wall biosynthesis